MKKTAIFVLMLLPSIFCIAQEQPRTAPPAQQNQVYPARMTPQMTEFFEPEVKIIQPAVQPGMPPSDAIVLFNGKDVNKEWEDSRGNPTKWIVQDGDLVCVKGSGVIQTKRKFNDFQLHIEWKAPSEVKGDGQGRGNSGVYLQGLYEVQVLDSYDNKTYRQGQAGALYKQYAPLVNASRKPGEWQTYDIIYTAPRFGADSTIYFTPPRVTVLHNGVLIQNNVSLRGPTLYVGIPEYSVKKHGAGPIVLQDHGNPVAYRNIWIREL
ncbi:MAG TPA: DUF1080 domain-containing protein [Bacteroidales bacterium]|jgi:hypothetical protein|nr:DUF1080 domain-containing protein [Bacteroidales bacterium]HBZ21557.1 DUF1080 domain-containing protein [Bacteroidales bacterium]